MHKKSNILFVFLLFFFNNAIAPAIQAQEITIHSAKEASEFAVQNSRSWTIRRQKALLDMGAAKLGIQDFLPSFSFSFSESDSVSILAGDSRVKSLQVSVSQEIFNGGKKKIAYEAGRISALYAWQEFEGEFKTFLSTVISLYYQCLLMREMEEIREDLLRQAKDQITILKKETELGISLETDYLEYVASYMGIEQERDQGLRDMAAMERQFKTALNLKRETPIRIVPDYPETHEYFYYEPFLDYLWALVRNNSTALKKQQLTMEYNLKQYTYGKRWYLPVIGAQGSVSFNGNSYPLTEPIYSLQFTFDFSSLDFLNFRYSNSSGFEKERLQQLSNGISTDIRPLPAYPITRKQGELNILESTLQREEGERQLRESLYELVISHDNTLRTAHNAEQRIELMERRLAFSLLQLEKGEKSRIDYLSELSDLAQTKISQADYLTQASTLERNLEIQTGFPFGGLINACRNL
jgi:outer membrane protein TolC